MFEIREGSDGELVLAGRLDAAKADEAAKVLDGVTEPRRVDLSRLEYISSMGLGLLLKTQKRLVQTRGEGLRLINVSPHVRDVFRFAGFHRIFVIEGLE